MQRISGSKIVRGAAAHHPKYGILRRIRHHHIVKRQLGMRSIG